MNEWPDKLCDNLIKMNIEANAKMRGRYVAAAAADAFRFSFCRISERSNVNELLMRRHAIEPKERDRE